MTPTQVLNHAYNVICIIAAVSAELLSDGTVASLFPPKWAHAISLIAVAAMWIRSHRNLFINPDGTSAQIPYVPPKPPG